MQLSTREKILDTAIVLLWQHSYGAVSVEDICREAGVQKGSFYHYFPSKVDVVIEAFERLWESHRPLFDEVFSATRPPLERLRHFSDTVYKKQKETAARFGKVLGCPYMSCGAELSTQDERIRCKMDELFARATRYFETLLRDARAMGLTSVKSPAVSAQEMQSYIAGVMYQAKLKNDVEIIRRDLLPGLMRFFTEAKPARSQADRSVKWASM